MDELKTIKLYGALGARFGRVHRLAVASAAEAVRALCSQLPGFRAALETPGARYQVRLAGVTVDPERELARETGGSVAIVPVLTGAKRGGMFQTILGVALIAFAWWNPMGWAAGSAMLTGTMGMGVSLALGGVLQMLTPLPKAPSPQDSPENKPSYLFNGAFNSTQQGLPVPVVFGTMRVGSSVIAVGSYAEALPV